MVDDTTNKEGLTVTELGSDRLRCLDCGAYKDETPGEWLIDSGIIACPDCRDAYDLPNLHIGDHVQDREDDDPATMLVVGCPTEDASEYHLEDGGPTVATVNPDYPSDDTVVEVVFPERTDVALDGRKRYAYPRRRLTLTAPIHDRDPDEEEAGA